jgi:uncharacterized protein (TIGR03437 family)
MRIILFLALAGIAQAQTFTTVASFDAADGGPNWLIQGADGNFYGTDNNGTAFKLTPAGALATLSTFPAGSTPNALVQGSDGNFYGTILGFRTVNVPSSDPGSIFKLTPSGAITTLHAFVPDSSDGSNPMGGLVQGADGNFYGTTSAGGSNTLANGGGAGIVFKITPSGTLTKLHDFDGSDGLGPNGLILASDGNFYGTTERGGAGCPNDVFGNGCGTVFQMTPAGTLKTLYPFTGMSDGGAPTAGLVQGSDGNFYGTTTMDGQNMFGTIFKLTPTGVLTTLYNFPAIPGVNGAGTTLIQATDGNFYGTIDEGGGPEGHGTLFEMTPAGTVTTLHTFGGADGVAPDYLIQAKDGNLYGATASGTGPSPNGTVFQFVLASPNTPAIAATGGVLNGASFQPGIPSGSWMTIEGTNLSSKTDSWNNAIVSGALPTKLDDVQVMVGDQPAYVGYISPTQINAVAPSVPAGSVPVTVINANGTSQAVMAQVQAEQPAFFLWPGTYAVATHLDYSLAVKNGTFPGATTVPAKPGDVIILWGTGFGPTSPAAPLGTETPSGTTYNTANAVSVTIGTTKAMVYGAALAPGFAGLYQVAIQIPASLANGDYPVVATVSGALSPSTTMITVQQ